METLKISLRQCVVCKKLRSKKEFLRLARKAEQAAILWDEDRKIEGYGIYLCPAAICVNDFLNDKKLRRRYYDYLSQECREKLSAFLKKPEISAENFRY